MRSCDCGDIQRSPCFPWWLKILQTYNSSSKDRWTSKSLIRVDLNLRTLAKVRLWILTWRFYLSLWGLLSSICWGTAQDHPYTNMAIWSYKLHHFRDTNMIWWLRYGSWDISNMEIVQLPPKGNVVVDANTGTPPPPFQCLFPLLLEAPDPPIPQQTPPTHSNEWLNLIVSPEVFTLRTITTPTYFLDVMLWIFLDVLKMAAFSIFV